MQLNEPAPWQIRETQRLITDGDDVQAWAGEDQERQQAVTIARQLLERTRT